MRAQYPLPHGPLRHGVRLGYVEWPHRQDCHLPKGAAPRAAARGNRRRKKARWRVPSWLLPGASRPRRDRRRERWRRPDPSCKGPDRGARVKADPSPYLEFMRALTPHFHWIAANLRCSLWLVVKHTDLWLNRVFDTAEDFRLAQAMPTLLRAMQGMTPETWESCLHITTSPIPRVVGDVGDEIFDRGLGPIGSFPLPQDLWDSVVLDFYNDGLQTFSVEDEWEYGDRVVKGASRWVSPQVERVMSALRGAGVHRVPADPLPPTCYPFVIPKSCEKVSLILSRVKQNKQDGVKPLTFKLDSWEDLARTLSRIPPREPPFVVHIDLKNAFWSFRLPPPPPRARRSLRFQPGPECPQCSWSASPSAGSIAPTSARQPSRGFCRVSSPLRCYWCTALMIFCSSTPIRESSARRAETPYAHSCRWEA